MLPWPMQSLAALRSAATTDLSGKPFVLRRSAACLLLAALLGGYSAASANANGPEDKTVFIGSVGPGYATLADPAVSAAMLKTGRIGLYQHANGNAGLTIAQRSALWATWNGQDTTADGTVAEVGGSAIEAPGYLQFFGGRYPAEVNMNALASDDGMESYSSTAGETEPGHVYGDYVSAAGLARLERQICGAVRHGAHSVAVVMTPNGGGEDLADGFAASPFWANVRMAALFGGGIGLDVPPTYWVLRGAGYQAQVARMVAWANANGLRSSLIVSPYAEKPDAAGHSGACGYDPAFMQNTRRLVADLANAGALPTQWAVENYGAAGPGCGSENDVAGPGVAGDPGSLDTVALSLASSTLVSRSPAMPQQALASCSSR